MGLSKLITGCIGGRKLKKKSKRESDAERREGDAVSGDGGDGGGSVSGGSGSKGSSGSSRSPWEREHTVGAAWREEEATSKGKEVATNMEETSAELTLKETFAMIDKITEELDPRGTDPEMDAAIRASLEDAAQARAGIDLLFGVGE